MLLNDDERDERREGGSSIPAYFFVFYRNPLFYVSVLMAGYSIFSIAIHTIWGASLGICVGLVSLVCSVWIAAAIYDHYGAPVKNLSSWVKLKGSFFLLAFLSLYAGLLYVQILQQGVFFADGSMDPKWTSFPNACRSTNDTPILNCVRAGPNVPSPTFQPGAGVITVPPFNSTLLVAVNTFIAILNQRQDFHDCSLLKQVVTSNTTYFLHWRCLTAWLGYPDDLAMQLTCVNGYVQAWFHSQSRLLEAEWDHGVNDARVRLILNYALLPNDWFPFADSLRNGSCFLD